MNDAGGTELVFTANYTGGALAAGASTVLAAAVAGTTCYLLWAHIQAVTAAAAIVNLEDTVPTIVFDVINTTITGILYVQYGRVPGTAGAGIRMRNTAGIAAGAVSIAIGYVRI